MKKQNNSMYIILLMAALFLFFIKTNQRGKKAKIQDRFTVENVTETYKIIRDTTVQISYDGNIICKMKCVGVSKEDINEIVQAGEFRIGKEIKTDVYPITGKTKAGKNIAISMLINGGGKNLLAVVNKDTSNNCDECK